MGMGIALALGDLTGFIDAHVVGITDGFINPDARACRLMNKTPLPFRRDAQMQSF